MNELTVLGGVIVPDYQGKVALLSTMEIRKFMPGMQEIIQASLGTPNLLLSFSTSHVD